MIVVSVFNLKASKDTRNITSRVTKVEIYFYSLFVLRAPNDHATIIDDGNGLSSPQSVDCRFENPIQRIRNMLGEKCVRWTFFYISQFRGSSNDYIKLVEMGAGGKCSFVLATRTHMRPF